MTYNYYSWVTPPSEENKQEWKVFLALGEVLIKLMETNDFNIVNGDEIENFFLNCVSKRPSDCNTDTQGFSFKPKIKPKLKRDEESCPLSREEELLHLLKSPNLFSFLGIETPFSAKAILAYLCALYIKMRVIPTFSDIYKLFRIIGIEVEDFKKEGDCLMEYVYKKEYLACKAEEPNPPLFFLSPMGFRNLLGIQIREDFKDTLELPDPLLRKFHKEAKKNKRSNDAVVSSISLNDVVLDEEAKTKIYYLIKAAKKDSQFVFKLLFSGPPGTGKTYTAKAIAGELNKKLFILDLSQTLNMFVGETEKSLSALFSEAEETNGIILIDEADSLLKERKTTFQRWESTEVNHILKLLEETKSPVILCTNLYESLDDALLRRIDEIVDFKIPDKIARALIWEKEIEKNGISSLNLNIDELTEIELSGGLISNVAKKAKIMMIAFEGERIIDTSEVKLFALDEKSKMGKDFFNKKICGFKV